MIVVSMKLSLLKNNIKKLKKIAFSAAQNGNMDMAIAAIAGDNVASIKKLIMKLA